MRFLALAVALVLPATALAAGLDSEAYSADAWSSSGIAGGTTSISGDDESLELSYNARGSGYVTHRTTTFSVEAVSDGEAAFDWAYDFHHAWFRVEADLWVYADGPGGRTRVRLVDFANATFTGPRSFSGSTRIEVHEGYDFGVIVGGSNFDSANFIDGTVTLTDFDAPGDSDGDGVDDGDDACPDTAEGAIVDVDGCSIDQICPADESWKNHGAYVSCVADTADAFVDAGLIDEADKGGIVSAAARSGVGKPASSGKKK